MAYCTHCGTHLPDDARFCPGCGKAAAPAAHEAAMQAPDPAPTRPASAPLPPLRRGGGGGVPILVAMIVVALLVIGVFLWSQRDGARPIAGDAREPAAERTGAAGEAAPAEAAARTTVAALDAAFVADPAGARRRHAGPVTLSGTVVSVTQGGSPSLSLEGRTRFNYVVANVADGAAFADVARGDRVTLACGGVTALAGTTILQDCRRS